jgi:hypothetical protein
MSCQIEVHNMKTKQKLLLLYILATTIAGCAPAGPALNLSEFNDKLSACFIADSYAAPQCHVPPQGVGVVGTDSQIKQL